MKIYYITKEPFPYGEACTNRVLTYAIELAKEGHDLTVLCLRLTDIKNADLLDDHNNCDYENIHIHYTCGKRIWPERGRRRIYKLYLTLLAYLSSFIYILKHRKEVQVLHMIGAEISMYQFYAHVCNLLSIPYVVERSELPDYIKNREKYNNPAGEKYKAKSEKVFHAFDGWLLETQNLVDFYSPFFKDNSVLCVAPMTVEIDRFSIPKQTKTPFGRYIGYCGNMREDDGMSILLNAFAKISSKYPEVSLVLAGESDNTPQLKELALKLDLEKRIIFLGRISRDQVPVILCNAEVLVLASPTSDRACATMPCKVGEYLATGNPVVVTGLGEINKYLQDGVSAYLSAPDSSDAFAEKLDEALSEPLKSKTIGEKGKEVAVSNFSSTKLTAEITEFYTRIIKNYKK